MEVPILYRDDHILVAVKPYGVLSEAHETRPNMPALLCAQCGGEVYPVHRLDASTEGVMVYARTRESAAALSETFRRAEAHKTYLAVVEGTPDAEGELSDLLYYDRGRNKSYVVTRERRGVKRAVLRYERLAAAVWSERAVSLVRIALCTGRTHQIRVQFASRGMPLAGDRRYGSVLHCGQIALCACALTFPHPVSGEALRFDITPTHELFGIL